MDSEFFIKSSRIALYRYCGLVCLIGGAIGAYLEGYKGALPLLLGVALVWVAQRHKSRPVVAFTDDAVLVQELTVGPPTKVLFSAIRSVEETGSLIVLETKLEKVRIPRNSLELNDLADIRGHLSRWLESETPAP